MKATHWFLPQFITPEWWWWWVVAAPAAVAVQLGNCYRSTAAAAVVVAVAAVQGASATVVIIPKDHPPVDSHSVQQFCSGTYFGPIVLCPAWTDCDHSTVKTQWPYTQ